MLLREETRCFCFLAGHESFAAAEGAIGIARSANKVRKTPLRVILNGLGKDAAYIISRVNGFTFVETGFDFATGTLSVLGERAFSDGERAAVRCYGANDVLEGVEIMKHEGVDVSITGNSTNPTRFQHLVAGTYKKWANENGQSSAACGVRRRHRPDAAPGQCGRRSGQLRPHRLDGPDALGRPVRREFLSAGPCGDDGSHRYGQQPDGRRHRGLCGGCGRSKVTNMNSRPVLDGCFFPAGGGFSKNSTKCRRFPCKTPP